MKHLIGLVFVILAFSFSYSCKNKKTNDDGDYRIYFVRHAEKGDDGTKDPPLTSEGIQRAERLADMLKYEKIGKVYSTNYKRTTETAKPVAHRSDLKIEYYEPGDSQFAKKLKNQLKNHSVLVVGHSNSTPSLVNSLIGENKFENIDEDNYGTMFVVSKNGDNYSVDKKNY